MKKVVSFILVLMLSVALLAGCAEAKPEAASVQPQQETAPKAETVEQAEVEVLSGGVLCLKVNPEIALHYDAEGKVVKLEGRNEDGCRILENFADCTGKDMELVLEELIAAIGKAGYFVEEVNGETQKVVLELDPGSCVPHEQFLQNMATCVKHCVERRCWVAAGEISEEAPAGRCPVCFDDDCDNGQYCDDYDDCEANRREEECRQNGGPCGTCGEYDCDDGIWCDDGPKHNNGSHNKHNGGHHG